LVDNSTRKPLIVPFFIPFQGCPHRCVFCEQEKITGQPARRLDKKEIVDVIERAFHSHGHRMRKEGEIAFYGGTFTGLPYETMEELLGAVTPYVREGVVRSIRLSTRPDALDEDKLRFLKERGVTTIELGAQSMSDEVLALTRRGHTGEDTIRAVRLLKKHQVRAGIQLMPGLPGDSEEIFLESVRRVIDLDVDMVRLYPTVVIRGTELARWYEEGRYHPLSLEEAVRICKQSCLMLERRGIPVIRIGLISSSAFQREGQIVSGPWHESFGHLVRSMIYFDKIRSQLPREGEAQRIRLRVPPSEISLMRGFKNQGVERLQASTGARIEGIIADQSLPQGQVKVEKL
jgi:histone acetyltransferase (RNA polymerase elongator complex component)